MNRSDLTGRAIGPTGRLARRTGPLLNRSDRSAQQVRTGRHEQGPATPAEPTDRTGFATRPTVNFTREVHATQARGNAPDLHGQDPDHARTAVNFTDGHRQKGTS
jgi:hypothetical protein